MRSVLVHVDGSAAAQSAVRCVATNARAQPSVAPEKLRPAFSR